MTLVLGIDAAWTEANPSGVALLKCSNDRRCVIECAPSYRSFVERAEGAPVDWRNPAGGGLDVGCLLTAAKILGGAPVDVVAIDMPLAQTMIVGRRTADQEVSKRFGSAWASTHSPTTERPGRYGHQVTEAFIKAGFSLATSQAEARPGSLIEVYPLAALVRLMKLARRPPYKVGKRYREWGKATTTERVGYLVDQWAGIVACLEQGLSELVFRIPERSEITHLSDLKPYEDALDAVISAYVGALFLEGAAEPFGDSRSAIWIPRHDCVPSVKQGYLEAVQTTLPEWDSSSDNRAFCKY